MTDKEMIEFAYFFERYRYNNEYRHLSDHRFLMVYKFYVKNENRIKTIKSTL